MTWVACPKNDWLEIYQIVLRIDDQFCVYLVTLYLGQMDPKSKTQIAGMIFGVKKAEPILKLKTGSSISPWIGTCIVSATRRPFVIQMLGSACATCDPPWALARQAALQIGLCVIGHRIMMQRG